MWLLLCLACLLGGGCREDRKRNGPVELTQLLNAVTNDKIEFITTSVDGAPLPTRGRRVIVTGPPDAVKLLSIGDVRVLEGLVNLLPDPHRAWAAEVLLASLTGYEEDMVNAFAARSDQWQESVGKNAYERWSEWLKPRRGRLGWDARVQVFVESGEKLK
jgi:hypothetical protein